MGLGSFFETHFGSKPFDQQLLSITMAWTPFGLSWADAMQNAGAQGQQAGQQIVSGFQFPLDAVAVS